MAKNGTMSRYERREQEIKAALAKSKTEVARPVERVTYTQNDSFMNCILLPKMNVFGCFKRVPGLLEKPHKRTVAEVMALLDTFPVGAEFIGQHGGRRVVGVRNKVCATIEFADVRSPLLPPLPKTML